jgi:hypothetical protein
MAIASGPIASLPIAGNVAKSSNIVSSYVLMAGSGVLSAAGKGVFTSATTISGVGSFVPANSSVFAASLVMSGVGVLNPTGTGQFASSVILNGTGSLVPFGSGLFLASSTLSGTGAINPVGVGQFLSSATMSGIGTFSPASSSGSVVSSFANLSGVGAATFNGQSIFASTASLSGIGSLNVQNLSLFATSAILSGIGSLVAYSQNNQITSSYAILGGVGSLIGYPPTIALTVLPNSYASLEMARLYLTEWDDHALAIALQVATSLINDFLKVNYLQEVTSELYKAQYERKILLSRGPINSIISVSRMSENSQTSLVTLPSNSYANTDKFLTIYPTLNYQLTEHLPKNRYEIFNVTYDAGFVLTKTAGYTIVPSALATATIETAKAILMARTADFNVTGESAAGAYSMQYNVKSVGNIPPTAQKILQPYRRTAKW